MTQAAPIAIFAYNRPDHLRETLANLRRCEGFESSPLFVFADGAKTKDQQEHVIEVRAIAREMLGEQAEYRFSEINKGLATSIVGGVKEILSQYGRVIVVEDDLIAAPDFLNFMNAALERYADEERVCQISGYSFDIPEVVDRGVALFLPHTSTWGWATWQRAWEHYDDSATGWEELLHNREMRKRFNNGGVYDHTSMLQRQMRGKCDSWGIRWYWSVFRRNGLVLFPPKTLVRNTGMDGTGTHGGGLGRSFDRHDGELPTGPIALPDKIAALPENIEAMRRAIWRQNGGWTGWSIDILRKIARR